MMTENYYWRDVVTCWEGNALNQFPETCVTVIPLLLLQEEFVERHALDFPQFYAQYKSQITYSRALNYWVDHYGNYWNGMGHCWIQDIKSRKNSLLKRTPTFSTSKREKWHFMSMAVLKIYPLLSLHLGTVL